MLVLLRDQADLRRAVDATDRRLQGELALATLREAQARSAGLVRELDSLSIAHRDYWIANTVALRADGRLLERLARRPDVMRIESDGVFRAPALEAATRVSAAARGVEWNVARIGAPALWELGHTGKGLVYANSDTGIDWELPTLKTHYRGFDGTTATHDYNWWDAIHADLDGDGVNACGYDLKAPCDDSAPISHGSHTMGTAIGDDGAGNQIGVAPGATWIGCRSMENGLGRPSTYLECLQFFLAPTDLAGLNPDPAKRPDVVGNSYACPPDEGCAPETLRVAVDNLRAAGVFMAVSAGNEGRDGCASVVNPPGTYDSAVSVGAVDAVDRVAGFSSRGPVTADGSSRRKPDLVAPGVSIRSSVRGGYAVSSGTSMAAPHVGGAVLLLWSALPALRRDVDGTERLLEQTALPLSAIDPCGGDGAGQVPNNTWGYGRIDALAAFRAAESVSRPQLSISDVSVKEGNAPRRAIDVRVGLSVPATAGVSVSYATRGASARPRLDFAPTTGTLSIEQGRTTAVISLPIVGDRVPESDETFSLELSDPRGATLSRGRAVITIRDDDTDTTAPAFVSLRAAPSTPSSGRPFTVIAILSEPSSLACRVERRIAGRWQLVATVRSKAPARRVQLPVPRLRPGAYRLRCLATDLAANAARSTLAVTVT